MKTQPETQIRRDHSKLLFLAAVLVGMTGIFVANPALSTPTLLSIVISMLLSPWVANLERRGISRGVAIMLVFAAIACAFGAVTYWVSAAFQSEWLAFKEKAPEHFRSAITSLQGLEQTVKDRYPFLGAIHPTDALVNWEQGTGQWFAANGPGWVGSLLTWILIVPPLTFVMLNDGRDMRKRFFQLVPNRYFESFFLVSHDITVAISDYLRAKILEAFLLGLMTTLGLLIVKAPYALVLGIAAGLTNIVPYAGPVIGAIPGLLIAAFDDSGQSLLWPVSIVYVAANAIDTVLIFPLVVAKLVKLHPLLLIAVVAIGQQYYGLVGMLISIPIATAVKVILSELHSAIYEQRTTRREYSEHAAPATDPSLEEENTA